VTPVQPPRYCIARPWIPPGAMEELADTLNSRWIGQGPKVDRFEKEFERKFGVESAVAVNSGTAALELAYDLIGIGPGDEVITTPLTCTATNIPLLRRGAKIVFADIRRDTLTIDKEDVNRKITARTKAIVMVNLNGIDSGPEEFLGRDSGGGRIPVVVDSSQALGNFGGDYTTCSFQAIKHITTGDGGMLVCRNPEHAREAKLLRWFGIDRELKIGNNWQPYKGRAILFDIELPGYKYQMNDIAAALGLAGLRTYDRVVEQRRAIFEIYRRCLPMVDGPSNKYGYACLLVEDRAAFADKMAAAGIETNVLQVRNDAYKIFRPFRIELPNMDWVEDRYISIPLHNHLTLDDARYIAGCAARACL